MTPTPQKKKSPMTISPLSLPIIQQNDKDLYVYPYLGIINSDADNSPGSHLNSICRNLHNNSSSYLRNRGKRPVPGRRNPSRNFNSSRIAPGLAPCATLL